MTSLAFIFGCIPLWTASGAGSIARQIMGTTVIGGMLAASALGIFFVPVMFCIVEKLSKPRSTQEIAASALRLPSQNPGAGND
jgi:HAE1 family hydrophobic/amphiphilic exporter-1